MLKSIHQSLRTGGRFVVVDFKRIPGVSSAWLLKHVKHNQKQVTKQITSQGFVLTETITIPTMKDNYFMFFKKK